MTVDRPEPRARRHRSAAPYRILVVDDEPDVEPMVLQRLRRAIRAGRYEFVFAGNGVEALARLQQDPDIEVVLSDINMPEMDGLTLLEQIPKVDPNIRSVIVSAYGDMKNIRTAMNRGAFDFITKPIDFDDLTVTLDRTLRHVAEWRKALGQRDKLIALQNELEVATRIQQSILPTVFPSGAGFEILGRMEPAQAVGGDFYDVLRLDNGRIGLAVADVCGKGVPAALLMMSTRTLLKGAAYGLAAPEEVLEEVNDLLNQDNDSEMFVTMTYAVYNPVQGTVRYASGGHASPLLVRPDGRCELLPGTGGSALGLPAAFECGNRTVGLEDGDTLMLYTDGVTEAMNAAGEQFGNERLQRVFEDLEGGPAGNPNEKVFEALHEFTGETPRSDDITCLTLKHDHRR